MTTPRRSVNIYDYPEHLNPFYEDDNHTKLRFWTTTKKKTRSNSFSFQSIKDFKQSLFSRPRNRSGTSGSLSHLSCYRTNEKNDEFSRTDEGRRSFIYPTLRKLGRSFSIRSKKRSSNSLDRSSDIENDVQLRNHYPRRQPTPSEMQRVSVTPLPRIRFHERIKNPESEKSQPDSPSEDTNPFKDENETRVSVTPRASISKPSTPPRKKKRAPPPPARQSSLTRKSLSAEVVTDITPVEDNIKDKVVINNDTNDAKTNEEIIENIVNKQDNITDEKEVIDKQENIEKPIVSEEINTENDNDEKNSIHDIDDTSIKNPEINYNSELVLSSSETSVSSETKLEVRQQQQAIEDSSDLLELVQKLQLEVEKMTDDTNNNIITPEFKTFKKLNSYECDEEEQHCNNRLNNDAISPLKMKQEITVVLDSNNVDDDDDVIISNAPLSPRLVRLRKDNEWIKHNV